MKMVSGWWSDRVRRRKPIVVAGYSIAAVARPLIGLAASWTQVLAIRFTDRVGKGIRTSPRDALLADLVPPEQRGRAFGLQRAMDNAGAVAGPLLAAAPAQVRLRGRALGLSARGDPGARRRRPARLRRERAAETAAGRRRPHAPAGPLPRRLWTAIGIFVLFTLASSTDAFLMLRASDAGVALWQLPLLWAFFNGVKAVAGVPGGALADRLGRVPAIVAGWRVYAMAYVGFALCRRPGPMWALLRLLRPLLCHDRRGGTRARGGSRRRRTCGARPSAPSTPPSASRRCPLPFSSACGGRLSAPARRSSIGAGIARRRHGRASRLPPARRRPPPGTGA